MTVRFACAVGVAIVVAGVMGVLATAGRDALSHEDSAGCPIVADEAFINSLNAEERAEVVAYQRLVEAGGWNQAKQKGWLKLEGKEYVIQDGDVVVIRHG